MASSKIAATMRIVTLQNEQVYLRLIYSYMWVVRGGMQLSSVGSWDRHC